MALPATDTFTTGADAALTTYSGSWSNNSGAFRVIASTDNVHPNSSGNECGARWNADTFGNDQYSQVVIPTITSTAAAVGAAVRCATGGGASYYGYYTDVNNSYLFVMSAGTWTQLGSNAAAFTTGQTLRIEASGTTITPYKNGSTTGTPGAQTDGTLSAGAGGLSGYGNDGTNRLDTWEAGNLGGASYNESGAGIAGAVAAGAYSFAAADTGAGIAGGVASGGYHFDAVDTGAGVAGAVAAGTDAVSAIDTGAGIAGAVASGAEFVGTTESGAGIAGAVAAGADAQSHSEGGYGLAGAVASGAEQFTSAGGTTYNESGAGVCGAVAQVADLAEYIEAGYSVAGAVTSGADGWTASDTGYGLAGALGAGAYVYSATDTGYGLAGAIAAGLEAYAALDSGYALVGAVASGYDSVATAGDAARRDYTRQIGAEVAQAEAAGRASEQTTAQAGQVTRTRGRKVA